MEAGRPSTSRVDRLTSFGLAAAATVFLSLSGGGAYDVVVRHEVGIVIWTLIGAGVCFGVLPIGRPTTTSWVLLGAMASLAVWTVAGVGWSDSAERTTTELGRIVFYSGIVGIVILTVDRGRWRSVLAGIFVGAAVVLVLALLSRLFPGAFPTNHLALRGGSKRLAYPFGYWNSLGCLAAMMVGAGLAVSANVRRPAVRAAALALLAVTPPVIYLTYSRGAVVATAVSLLVGVLASRGRWVAAMHAVALGLAAAASVAVIRAHDGLATGQGTSGRAGLLAAVALGAALLAATAVVTGHLRLDQRLRMSRPRARFALASSAVALLLVAAMAGPGLASEAWDSFTREENTPSANAQSANDPATRLTNLNGPRVGIWESALRAAETAPIHGIGPGTFEFWWDADPEYKRYVRDAHNLYLEALAETGVIGLLLILAVVAVAIGAAWQATRRRPSRRAAYATAAAAAVSTWAIFAAYDWMWESPAVTAMALAAAGCAAASRTSPRSDGVHWLARAGGVAASAVAIAVMLPTLSATSQVRGSEQAAARGDLATALSRANDAVAAEPWAASPYLQRALVLELGDHLDAAATDARRAADREPTNYRTWLILSRIEAKRGRVEAALAAFRTARDRKPVLLRRIGVDG